MEIRKGEATTLTLYISSVEKGIQMIIVQRHKSKKVLYYLPGRHSEEVKIFIQNW